MSQTHNTVFISYRRSISWSVARLIYADLQTNGYDVFMDVASFDSGTFDTIILRQIEARAHFLLVCAPGTFDRINQPEVRLRREIEHALAHGRNIVPIFVDNFSFNSVTHMLSGRVANLLRYNGVNAPHDYFEEALTRLRTRFLKLPVSVAITVTPAADRAAVAEKQREVERQMGQTNAPPDAQAHLNHGIAHHSAGDFTAALTSYTEALSLYPQYAEAYYHRGRAHDENNDLDAAIADFSEAIRLQPKLIFAYTGRALARYDNADIEGAIADYSEAIKLSPQSAFAFTGRGLAREDKGDLDGAIAD